MLNCISLILHIRSTSVRTVYAFSIATKVVVVFVSNHIKVFVCVCVCMFHIFSLIFHKKWKYCANNMYIMIVHTLFLQRKSSDCNTIQICVCVFEPFVTYQNIEVS